MWELLPLVTPRVDKASGFDPLADDGGGFGVDGIGEVFVLYARHFDVQVDAVEQGAGKPAAIALT